MADHVKVATTLALCCGVVALCPPSYARDRAAACAAAKRNAAAKKANGKLKCAARAASRGVPVDARCLAKVEAKFAAVFAKADARGGCATTDDAGTVEASVDTCVSTLRTLLAVPGTPPRSACTARKLRATGRNAAEALRCHARAAARSLPVDSACLTRAEEKHAAAFAKAESRGDCLTVDDAAAVGSEVDACVTTVAGLLPGATTTTSTTTPATTTTLGPTCSTEPAAFAGITAQHNATRASASPVPDPPLDAFCWDDVVGGHAQAWADGCQFGHDPDLLALEEGQNIFAEAVGVGFPTTAAQDAEPAWAAEAVDYDYSTNTCSAVCGHYTQIVWRSTQVVGCGIKNCTVNSPFGPSYPSWTLVACNYKPPGNLIGQRPY
jgi:pathogenesis-related protein 1